MATLLEGFTLPLKMSLANMATKEEMEATLRMDGTVFDYELQKSWPDALAYVRHYTEETVLPQDAMRLLAIREGFMADTTLWQIVNRLPGVLENAGLTDEQIVFRNRVSALPCPLEFTVIDETSATEHVVTLRENYLFSSKWDHGMSGQEVCRIFKDWSNPSLDDAMTVLYYTDTDGKEWPLSDIVALSPFRQACFPAKPTDVQIIAELKRYFGLIAEYETVAAKVGVAETFMKFLFDECVNFITWHPAFRLVMFDKCDEFITKHSEFPDLVAACERLVAFWKDFRP